MADTKTKAPTKKAAPAKRPPGRPTLLNDRTASKIVDAMRRGCYVEEAAAESGVAKRTVYNWQREAARIERRIEDPDDPLTPAKLKAGEARLLSFLHAVEQAEDEWLARANATLDELAFGGIETTTVTVETDKNGDEVKKTVKTETLLPSAAVLQWRMERKRPAVYGRRAPLEVNIGSQADNPLKVEVEVVTPEQILGQLRAVQEAP